MVSLVARFFLTPCDGLCSTHPVAQWPGVRRRPRMVGGALMQGIYLCASYWAISRGLAAGGNVALGALQPFVQLRCWPFPSWATLQPRAWAGLLIGFAGVGPGARPKLASHGWALGLPLPVAAVLVSLFAVTTGTVWLKAARYDGLRTTATSKFRRGDLAALAVPVHRTPRWDGGADSVGCA